MIFPCQWTDTSEIFDVVDEQFQLGHKRAETGQQESKEEKDHQDAASVDLIVQNGHPGETAVKQNVIN